MRLGVLDQSPISEGSTGAQALRNTLDLARHAEELGYERYWVAEHHNTPMLASASPEALVGPVAAATDRMRVGSGGVMLPHYSPYKVAETFSALAGLYPGRIDLGIGRAPGTDPRTALLLQRDRTRALPDDFPQQLEELLVHLHEAPLPLPGLPESPQPWLLGSSPQSGVWARQFGLPYAFADFISPGADARADIVCVWAICAETEEEARRLSSSSRMTMSLLRRGTLIPVPPVEKALRYLEGRSPGGSTRRAVIGDPDGVRAGIEQVASAYGADEVMVVTITYDHEARRRSYELIAEAFGLRAGAARAAVTAEPSSA